MSPYYKPLIGISFCFSSCTCAAHVHLHARGCVCVNVNVSMYLSIYIFCDNFRFTEVPLELNKIRKLQLPGIYRTRCHHPSLHRSIVCVCVCLAQETFGSMSASGKCSHQFGCHLSSRHCKINAQINFIFSFRSALFYIPARAPLFRLFRRFVLPSRFCLYRFFTGL